MRRAGGTLGGMLELSRIFEKGIHEIHKNENTEKKVFLIGFYTTKSSVGVLVFGWLVC